MGFVSDYMYSELTILEVGENTLSLTHDRCGDYAQIATEGVLAQTTHCSPKITLNTGIKIWWEYTIVHYQETPSNWLSDKLSPIVAKNKADTTDERVGILEINQQKVAIQVIKYSKRQKKMCTLHSNLHFVEQITKSITQV